MTKPPGKLVIFEGPDAAGKTTVCREVSRTLSERGISHELIHLPGNLPGTFGKFVYDLHHEPGTFSLQDLEPTSLQMLHAAAHIDTISRQIRPALDAGRWVILDRFWWSTMVYGKLTGADPQALKVLRSLAKLQWKRVSPTVAFLILRRESCDPQIAAEYQRLLRSLRESYPRHTFANDGSIQSLVEKVLAIMGVGSRESAGMKSENELITDKRTIRATSSIPWIPPEPINPTVVFDSYWRFAAERQEVMFRRLAGATPPWTHDPIIQRHRFTNAYRASDRVSQYLIRHVIYNGNWSARDLLFRILLFKLFNKIETWQLLERKLGTLCAEEFAPRNYSRILREARDRGTAIYSAAYIMASGKSAFGHDCKHENHLELLKRMLQDDLPSKIRDAASLAAVFSWLVQYPGLGSFLGFQFAIDINYSTLTDFDEMSFVVPGPGARDGIAKCFTTLGGLNETEIIRWTAERQGMEFERLGLRFRQLGNRPLQLIDCQNLFCEVDKYARAKHPEIAGRSGRTRIKQVFSSRAEPLSLWFPPKWGINQFFGLPKVALGGSDGSLFGFDSERNMVVGRTVGA